MFYNVTNIIELTRRSTSKLCYITNIIAKNPSRTYGDTQVCETGKRVWHTMPPSIITIFHKYKNNYICEYITYSGVRVIASRIFHEIFLPIGELAIRRTL